MPGLSAFNATHEAERRQQLEVQFNKTRENEEEEGKLREELKSIDQQIKKLKQSSKSSSKQGDEIQALADARRLASRNPPHFCGMTCYRTFCVDKFGILEIIRARSRCPCRDWIEAMGWESVCQLVRSQKRGPRSLTFLGLPPSAHLIESGLSDTLLLQASRTS